MAFLRFTRDKRGYESTFLLQNSLQAGKVRSRVLYWFRTPPNVKVGRAVLDEEAIRLIEEANPDIDIEWDKVLKAKPPARPAKGPDRGERSRRRPRDGSPDQRPRTAAQPVRASRSTSAAAESPDDAPKAAKRSRRGRRRGASASVEPTAATVESPSEIVPGPAVDAPPVASLAEIADVAPVVEVAEVDDDALPRPDPDELLDASVPDAVGLADEADEPDESDGGAGRDEPRPHPVAALVGSEGHARLQARYAELLARISERVTDPTRRDELRTEAEGLDPDGWVTVAEARAALETFDARYTEFRNRLGRRRRRSRRGGRRRRGGAGADAQRVAASTDAAEPGNAAVESAPPETDEPDGNR